MYILTMCIVYSYLNMRFTMEFKSVCQYIRIVARGFSLLSILLLY